MDRRTVRRLLIMAAVCLALLISVAAAATPTGLTPTPADQAIMAVTGALTPEVSPARIDTSTLNTITA